MAKKKLDEWKEGKPKVKTQDSTPRLHVLIDPAHGGFDSGTYWRDPETEKKYKESHIVLNFAKAMVSHFPAYMTPFLTRDKDIHLETGERFAWLDRKTWYDIAITIHCHGGSGLPNGPFACILDLNDPVTKPTADKIVEACTKVLGPTDPKKRITGTKNGVLRYIHKMRDVHGYAVTRLRPNPVALRKVPMTNEERREMNKQAQWPIPAIMLVLGNLDNEPCRNALLSTAKLDTAAALVVEALKSICPKEPVDTSGFYARRRAVIQEMY